MVDSVIERALEGEGRDTTLDPDTRVQTMRNVRESGLSVGTCVEPVGNEHTTEELVETTLVTHSHATPAPPGASPFRRRAWKSNASQVKHASRQVLAEAEWEVLEGPSVFYGGARERAQTVAAT